MNSLKAFVAGALVMAFGLTATFGQGSHYDVSNIDPKTAACADFYQYANGGWLAANPIPAAYPAWGVANVLNEKNRDVLRQILEAAASNATARKGSNEQKVGDYYASCMDEAKIEADGLKPIQAELDLVNKVTDQKSLQAEIAHLHSFGYNAVFGSGSNRDFKNAADVIIGIQQGGLGLPTRDYYFKDDARSKMIRDEYVKHIAKMFELMGDDSSKAASEAQAVMTLETKLAEASKAPVDLREPEKLYHRMPVTAVKDLAPTFDWVSYAQNVAHSKADVNVATPDFFKAMETQLNRDRWPTGRLICAGTSSIAPPRVCPRNLSTKTFTSRARFFRASKRTCRAGSAVWPARMAHLVKLWAPSMCRRLSRPRPKRERSRWSKTWKQPSRATSRC